jgi:hypothetical protein
MTAGRKNAAPAFNDRLYTMSLKKTPQVRRKKAVKSLAQEWALPAEMFDEIGNGGVIGQVAAKLPTDEDFSAGLVHLFQQKGPGTTLPRLTGSHQTCGTSANHDKVISTAPHQPPLSRTMLISKGCSWNSTNLMISWSE